MRRRTDIFDMCVRIRSWTSPRVVERADGRGVREVGPFRLLSSVRGVWVNRVGRGREKGVGDGGRLGRGQGPSVVTPSTS